MYKYVTFSVIKSPISEDIVTAQSDSHEIHLKTNLMILALPGT